MPCKLVQKKQFALAEHHFLAANDIGLSLTDIKHGATENARTAYVS